MAQAEAGIALVSSPSRWASSPTQSDVQTVLVDSDCWMTLGRNCC